MSAPPSTPVTPRQIAAAFLRPTRRTQDRMLDFLPGGVRFTIDGPAGKLAGSRAGAESAPLVLLVHGWGGTLE